jgi:uncharacterized protein YndB with AHSA1/START domain
MIAGAETTTLELRRTMAHAPQKVYAAFTEPARIVQWFGPRGYETIDAQVDLRAGGAYRFTMRQADGGEPFSVAGVYEEIVPGKRLAFTWHWENSKPGEEFDSLVTVEFLDAAEGTELVLRHERFPAAEVRDKHIQGWSSTLERLPEALEAMA